MFDCSDFIKILEEMDGLSTTIRLLDPPLHEFLPDISELRVKSALNRERNTVNEDDDALLHAVELMHESNPMLGLRGVRLGLVSPGLYELQVRAIAEAMAELITRGLNPRVEIMIPLVGSHMELRITRTAAEHVIQNIAHEKKIDLSIAETATQISLVTDSIATKVKELSGQQSKINHIISLIAEDFKTQLLPIIA